MTSVRPLPPADEPAWRGLWRGYLDFYETELPEEVYAASFARLIDPAVADYHGLIALGGAGGRSGSRITSSTATAGRLENICYLQDLYVAPEARGAGAGRALIEAVYAAADAAGRAERLLADRGIQHHRPAALRPGGHRHAASSSIAAEAPGAPPPPRLPRALRARRLRRAAAAMPEITSVRFAAATLPRGVARSNRDLAEDFLELTFALESGETLAGLLRYETPIRVYMRSPDLAAYRPDLAALLARLRDEAGIDIAETGDPAAAQIQIEAVPAAQITRVFPTAACFIVPGETDWQGFLRRPPGRPHPLVGAGDAGARRDLPAARHHAAGRARLPERGDHPGARAGQRPLPAAGLDLERRQLPRSRHALRHADPARALPAGARAAAWPREVAAALPRAARPREPPGARQAAPRRASRNRASGPAPSRRRCRATRRAPSGWGRRRSPPRSPPRCARSTTGSASRC